MLQYDNDRNKISTLLPPSEIRHFGSRCLSGLGGNRLSPNTQYFTEVRSETEGRGKT